MSNEYEQAGHRKIPVFPIVFSYIDKNPKSDYSFLVRCEEIGIYTP